MYHKSFRCFIFATKITSSQQTRTFLWPLMTSVTRGFTSSITSDQSELRSSFSTQQSHGVSCYKGKLKNNEDRYDIIRKLVPGFSYFAVFDGHRGHFGAEFLRNELSGILAKNIFPDKSLAAQGKELVEISFETCEHLLEVEILANNFEKKERGIYS